MKNENQKAESSKDSGFIDRAELARRLKVSIGSVHNYCRQGKIGYIKLGRRVVFDWDTVRECLLRQQRGGGE
jgi:predicted site-specific integrase-resolvase